MKNNQAQWDLEADVIVVGAGGSGLAAALKAAECGASVIVLEKCSQVGGTTAMAVGSFTSAGTLFQKAAGVEDNPFWHDQDMAEFAGPNEPRNNSDLRKFFAHETSNTLAWLVSLGLDFYGPSPEPPNRVPRMHNVIPSAKAYVSVLEKKAQDRGAVIRVGLRVSSLLKAGGAVYGVEAESENGGRVRVSARRGVVLATGDYSSGTEIKGQYLPSEIASVDGVNPSSTGDGHKLARAVGATLINMDLIQGPQMRFITPEKAALVMRLPSNPLLAKTIGLGMSLVPQWVIKRVAKQLLVAAQQPAVSLYAHGAVLINRDGARFCDETNRPELRIPGQPGKLAYILLDKRLAQMYSGWPHYISTAPEIAYAYVQDYKRFRPDIFAEAVDLKTLAKKIGARPDVLEASMEAYNRAAVAKVTDDFGRLPSGEPLQGPFCSLGPIKSWIVTTEGGVRLNERMQVLDSSGEPIGGLYAAGSTGMGGLVLLGHGLHIAWAITSGRLAGSHAASNGSHGD